MATKVVVCTCIIFFKLCQKAMLRFASSKKGWCNGESKSFYANTHFRYFCILDKESKALPLFASINPSSYIKINDVKTDAKAMQWVAINAKRLTFPPLLDKVVKILGNQGICYSNPSWNADDAFGGGKLRNASAVIKSIWRMMIGKIKLLFRLGSSLFFP